MHVPLPGAGYILGSQKRARRHCRLHQIGGSGHCGPHRSRYRLDSQPQGQSGRENRRGPRHEHVLRNQVRRKSLSIRCLPIIRKQGNAFLAAPRVHGETFHYFDTGIKRLIIELEMDNFAVFLVHLSLKYRHRHLQLRRLHDLIEATEKPVIVAGDFNTFWGENEIYLFKRAAGLKSANTESLPSYPSRSPRKELDFILYQAGIEVSGFDIPQVRLSDHLPLVCDFEVK